MPSGQRRLNRTAAPQALIDFEDVISMEPKNYLGDDFSRVTQIFRVAQYNVACCYSAIDQARACAPCPPWPGSQQQGRCLPHTCMACPPRDHNSRSREDVSSIACLPAESGLLACTAAGW